MVVSGEGCLGGAGGGTVTPYNGLYGEAPPERDTLSGFRYMKE